MSCASCASNLSARQVPYASGLLCASLPGTQIIRGLHPSVAMSPEFQCPKRREEMPQPPGLLGRGRRAGRGRMRRHRGRGRPRGLRVSELRLRLAEPSRSRRRTFILRELHVRSFSDLRGGLRQPLVRALASRSRRGGCSAGLVVPGLGGGRWVCGVSSVLAARRLRRPGRWCGWGKPAPGPRCGRRG